MCRRWSDFEPCTNFKCPNNLFWEDLKLNREKIWMTDKALEIRNCCCLIMNPWTSGEISNVWGLTNEEIRRSEEEAFKKLQRKVRINGKRSQSTIAISRRVVV
jgi:DNA-directed RNA polymerase sigma subunit (sigma70/sigma32)